MHNVTRVHGPHDGYGLVGELRQCAWGARNGAVLHGFQAREHEHATVCAACEAVQHRHNAGNTAQQMECVHLHSMQERRLDLEHDGCASRPLPCGPWLLTA